VLGVRHPAGDQRAPGETANYCRLCRHQRADLAPDDEDRAWWLARFGDAELVEIAMAVWDKPVPEARFARAR
jgi:hypothetical protein